MPLPTHQPVWLSTQTKRSTLTLSSFPSPAHGHGSALKQVKILPTTVIGRHKQDRHFPWPRPSQSPSLIWKTRASIKLSSHGQKLEFFTMIFFFGQRWKLYSIFHLHSGQTIIAIERKEREATGRKRVTGLEAVTGNFRFHYLSQSNLSSLLFCLRALALHAWHFGVPRSERSLEAERGFCSAVSHRSHANQPAATSILPSTRLGSLLLGFWSRLINWSVSWPMWVCDFVLWCSRFWHFLRTVE